MNRLIILLLLILAPSISLAHGTSGQLYNSVGSAFDETLAYQLSGAWSSTTLSTVDFAGPVTATSFTADDGNPSNFNTSVTNDNEGMAGDLTCASNGAAGELRIIDKSANTAGDAWVVCSGTTETLNLSDPYTNITESDIHRSPTAGTFYWMKAPTALTLVDVNCIVTGAGTTITLDIQECGSDGTSCSTTLSSAITCDDNQAVGTITNASIDSGDWLRVTLGTPSGSVTSVAYTIEYEIP